MLNICPQSEMRQFHLQVGHLGHLGHCHDSEWNRTDGQSNTLLYLLCFTYDHLLYLLRGTQQLFAREGT
jgi:hypothetical protein